ncbi:uncharacterized protein METZ01_LOCUS378854 [marine metagenome]|uniref:Uncharacterized protein n=1 Tax=marine metagenome TaxID=408172 RepID=A0A382TVA2_9ZZZZ
MNSATTTAETGTGMDRAEWLVGVKEQKYAGLGLACWDHRVAFYFNRSFV